MSKPVENTSASHPLAASSWFAGAGTALTIAAGLSFLFVCMILPLVGKAGVQTVHVKQNHYAFLAALLVSLLLSAVASWAKIARRRIDGSPLPVLSLALTALCTLLLVSLFAGLLKI